MICRQCGTENSDSARFCKGCGAPLEVQAAPQPEPVHAEPERNICPECGTLNTVGAKFCKSCGSKLGAASAAGAPISVAGNAASAAGAAGHAAADKAKEAAARFRQSGVGSNLLPMLKMSFTAPADAIRRAHEDEDNWLATVIAVVLKALIIGIIPTLKMRSMIVGQVGADYWNQYKDEVAQQLGFSFGGLCMTLIAISLICDAAIIFGVFGIGKAFGGKAQVKNWLGTVCPANMIGLCGSLIVVIAMLSFISSVQQGGGKGAIIFMCIALILVSVWQLVLMWKAFETEMELPENKAIYAFVLGMFVSIAIAMLFARLLGGMLLQNITNQIGSSLF